MQQSDKPTIAFAVIGSYGLEVSEIIGRTPKGVRLRSLFSRWRTLPAGEICGLDKVMAEFATREAADAALTRHNVAREAHADAVKQARVAESEALQARIKAQADQKSAALAALKGE